MGKKLIFISLAGLLILVLSGCVKKTEAPSAVNSLSPAPEKKASQPVSPAAQEEALPGATGKVDDLVNAVSNEADSEKNTLADEERAASDAAADAEEINNLEKSYDENEL